MTIAVSAVSKTYRSARGDDVTGLKPVTLSIAEGAFVSVVGRSGCGKSTLLRLLAGLETPSSGGASIGNEKIVRPPASVRYLFQNYSESLLPWKTVGGNIRFGLRHCHGAPPRDVDISSLVEKKLEEVGLSGITERYPAELSGGMQQRVAIARALAANPKVLLLDEPFSAVDALSRANLQDLLLKVWEAHRLTIVFVTHDIDEALYLSDRVVILAPNGGGIQLDVDVDLARPRNQIETRSEPAFLEMRRELLGRVLSAH
ncbi:ABC transporter ATP-binding protein [Neorhizobium lilium]|uniref:ABC transporter ATP-binding protein n=1 Tax=Neorhizobium lilium TaxID=2503024 RepID=A0A3S4UVD9_9HYPH|nr:ABC transporter ATP-binding protein [Neorhizobium lilium]RWX81641.1 ABC transporter ATP-binding protein [Neorhizobium lilium]